MSAVEATQCSIDEETRQLWLFGDVDNSMAQLAIPTLGLWGQEDVPIRVHLLTDGGCFQTGMGIFDAIEAAQCDVWTIAHGDVLSTGAVMFLAGDVRLMRPNARLMFHRPFNSFDRGTRRDLARADFQLADCERILSRIWLDLDLDEDDLRSVLVGTRDELWYDATRAISGGLAHGLSEC